MHRPAHAYLRIALLFLICLCPAASSKGTTAVVLRSRYRIVLAADSHVVYGTGRGATACKLFEVHDVYATVSGLANYGASYRATDAIRDGFAGAERFSTHVSATAFFLQRRVQKLLTDLQRNDFAAYRYLLQSSNPASDLVQLAVAQSINGRPMLGIIELERQRGKNGLIVKTTVCPGNCRQDNAVFYLGYWDRIQPYVADSGQPRSLGSAASLDRLIRLEVQAHPREVSAPINILEITNAGARWLQNGGNCSLPGVAW